MATQSTASGYSPAFHMPVISPPPQGKDADTYYNEVGTATTVQVTAADHQGLFIRLSNKDYSKLFAMTGGLIRFIPTGHPLPINEQEAVQGAGAVILQTWIADFDKLKNDLPPGVPAMTFILYLNVEPSTVRTALKPHVQLLTDAILNGAWNQSSPPASRAELETNYLDRLLLGETAIFVPGGTLLGEAASESITITSTGMDDGETLLDEAGAMASDRVFIFRFTDIAGNDLSPILHIRGMESYSGPQWHNHPLIQAVSSIPVPVNIYLQFEVWNTTSHDYEPLPAGVAVDLMDWDPVDDDPLITQFTDAQGRVHFSTSLEELDALDPDDAETDLYFLVHTDGRTHAGHTLPDQWSTKGWKATDGSPGYYENFTGSQLGEAATPLVFRIGFDFHIRIAYSGIDQNGNQKTGVAPEGLPLAVLVWADRKKELKTNTQGEVHGVLFDIKGEDNVLFRIDYELENPAFNLKRAVVNEHSRNSFLAMFITTWPISQVLLLDQVIWALDYSDLGNFLPNNDKTSLGKYLAPYVLRSTSRSRNAALYLLKTLREWSTFLYNITDRDWEGISGLNLNLVPTSISDIFQFFGQKLRSVSYPVENVNIVDDDYFNRKIIAHELSHQIMWKEVNISTLGIAYQALITRKLELNHWPNLLANPQQALIEGWAEFMAIVFGGAPNSVIKLTDDDGNRAGVLKDPPDGHGESVEGAFADGLWNIFMKYVPPANTSDARILESSDADATTHAPWITDPTAKQNFLNLIWNPLKDLRSVTSPGSTDMLNAIKSRNLALWHVLRAELQTFNMAMAVPGITSILPSSGPKTGGQSIAITGTDFVVGMTVEIGGNPASNVVVSSSTLLTAVTPGGVVGPSDVLVKTEGGPFTFSQSYTYL
ncbi:MAG: IPT/TIG domain-containing protein [Blastocatellia bacterium]